MDSQQKCHTCLKTFTINCQNKVFVCQGCNDKHTNNKNTQYFNLNVIRPESSVRNMNMIIVDGDDESQRLANDILSEFLKK